MKQTKRIISVLLLIAFIMSTTVILTLPSSAAFDEVSNEEAVSTGVDGYYTYEVSNGEATITEVDAISISGDITIPSTLGGYPVTAIGAQAFFTFCENITSITIPDCITRIEEDAFLNVPSNVFEEEAGVLYVDKWAVGANESVTDVTLRADTVGIGGGAFSHCPNLVSVTIPDSVKYIYNSFIYCETLTNITIGNGVVSIDGAFFGCTGITSVTIPDNVTSLGIGAFGSCTNLVNVTLGSGITSIEADTFRDCTSLKSITIPDNVTTIGDSAFYSCSSLETVIIGNNVTSIGNWAFAMCSSVKRMTIPDGLTSLGESALPTASTDSLEFNEYDNGYYLGNENNPYVVLMWRNDTRLTSCNIHENTKFIWSAFDACDELTSIIIPDSVISIGNEAFDDCHRLESVTIGKNIKSIGAMAFSRCASLKSIVIPDSVTSIGDEAFVQCVNLKSITIPASVTSIGNRAFDECENLTIKCYNNSYAHTYAVENNIKYTLISDEDLEEKKSDKEETTEGTEEKKNGKGCGSAVGGAVSVIAMFGAAAAFVGKKKKEQ